jgi:hypothetical protein
MSSLFGSFRKKTISLALAGTDIPFYLLDDTQIVLKIAPATTAAAACLAIRNHVSTARLISAAQGAATARSAPCHILRYLQCGCCDGFPSPATYILNIYEDPVDLHDTMALDLAQLRIVTLRASSRKSGSPHFVLSLDVFTPKTHRPVLAVGISSRCVL